MLSTKVTVYLIFRGEFEFFYFFIVFLMIFRMKSLTMSKVTKFFSWFLLVEKNTETIANKSYVRKY